MKQVYRNLLENLGDQGNWPAESPEEIILDAILVQNTRWENVVLSLDNLRQHLDGDFKRVLDLDQQTLQDLIRPTGFYKNKSKAVQEVFAWLKQEDFDYKRIADHYGDRLRVELLRLFGIGQEMADVLLLYVFNQAVFIADKYARNFFRVLLDKVFRIIPAYVGW